MNDYTAATYGDKIAEVYDEMYSKRANVDPTVDALTQLANGGAALELGIGTGRIAYHSQRAASKFTALTHPKR